MTSHRILDRLASIIDDLATSEGYSQSRIPGMGYVKQSAPSPLTCTMYEPVVCLILRGRKRTAAGPLEVDFGPGESLIVSHDVPVLSEVTEAPYLALILSIDMEVLGSLVDQITDADPEEASTSTLAVNMTNALILDALTRYALLANNPAEAAVLEPLVRKEIHFRLATAPHGAMLRRLLKADSTENTINRAIEYIRSQFKETLSIPELADKVGMSESTFHRHFKSITGTTPLQYQKALRLLEARRLISASGFPVSAAAYEVGYASSTQFSREYSREFGVSPRTHATPT